MTISRQTIQTYLWPPSHVNWVTPDPAKTTVVPDHDKEIRRKLADPKLRPSDNSQKMQNIIQHITLKKPLIAFRLCLFFNIRKGDIFEELEIVPTTISYPFLEHLLAAWKKYFPLIPKPMIAKISIPKGMHGLFPSQITKENASEGEFILGTNRFFYATDDPYTRKVGREKYQVVNLGVSFAVTEETYQKYKNDQNVPYEKLIKNDEKVRQRKYS